MRLCVAYPNRITRPRPHRVDVTHRAMGLEEAADEEIEQLEQDVQPVDVLDAMAERRQP